MAIQCDESNAKKCPFCGKYPSITNERKTDYLGGWRIGELRCCVVKIQEIDAHDDVKGYDDINKKLLDKWNYRTLID